MFGRRASDVAVKIKVNGIEIQRVKQHKVLGVIIDDKLSWKPQVSHLRGKIARSISILWKAQHCFNQKALLVLYWSLVSPHLHYCVEVWGNTYKGTLHPLEILQKKAIRIIYQANYRAHTNNFFIEGRILKLRDVVNYHTVQIIYKASKKSLPNSLQVMFEDREVLHDLRRKDKFTEKNIRTTLKSFSISVKGIKLWNGLDEVVTGSCSLRNFKANYVSKIIENYRLIT